MNLVVDASVVVKVIVDEPLSDIAEALLFKSDVNLLIAPELLLAEVGDVLWRYLRLNQITQAQVELARETIIPSFIFLSTQLLFPRALELARIIDHPIYDFLSGDRGTLGNQIRHR